MSNPAVPHLESLFSFSNERPSAKSGARLHLFYGAPSEQGTWRQQRLRKLNRQALVAKIIYRSKFHRTVNLMSLLAPLILSHKPLLLGIQRNEQI